MDGKKTKERFYYRARVVNFHAMKNIYFTVILALFFSCTSKKNAPDLILSNGKVWTTESDTSFVEAIAIKGNTILAVGTTEEINKLADGHTEIRDLKGKLVAPGFNDAHIHFLSGSLGLTEVNLTGTKSPDDVTERVNQFVERNPTKTWITGRGWLYSSFENSLPDATALSGITNEVPVLIKAYDGHSAWANKKALEIAGIDRHTTYTGFGEIVKDKNGEPTGTLRESAMGLVSKHIPPLTKNEKLDALRKGLSLAASLGITSIQNASGNYEEFLLYKELLLKNELTLRYAAAFSANQHTSPEDIAQFARVKDSVGLNNSMIRADAIKFMIDGVIESHTGYMLAPYADLPVGDPLAVGQLAIPIEKYQALVTEFDTHKFRVYTHAIGDKGVRESLNAYQYARELNGTRDARHRVEHIETISPDDIPRFSELSVMASMEPIHADPGAGGVWERAIGEERLPWSFAWADLLNQKAHLVFSSDWPACLDINPIRGIHVAVTRRNADGYPENGWVADQKINIAQALSAYTAAGAFSSFEENIKGKIKVGHLADVIVLSQDLFTIDPMKTHETIVELTIFNGKIIYEN